MVYKNKGGQPRERTMIAAYVMVKDFGSTQAHVAKALGCSQATIASWVKDVGYKKQIAGLEDELRDARSYIKELRTEVKEIEYKKAKVLEHKRD